MNYCWLLAALFGVSCAAQAYCPDEDQQVTFQGTLIQKTLPGPPNYESIREGDEALTYDYLQLEQPFECGGDNGEVSVSEVQLILPDQDRIAYSDLAPRLGKEVLVSGKTMFAQSGRHFTPVLLILDDVNVVTSITTPEQKKSALLQWQQFQQALREKNVAALKRYFVFPVKGELFDFIPYDENHPMETFTEAVFDDNAGQIIAGLQKLARLDVNPQSLTINEYRINALSAKERQRRYFPQDQDGRFYYEENGQRHTVDGVCDTVVGGAFENDTLQISQGTLANRQLPGMSEMCDGASVYIFKLVEGKLRMTGSFTAG